MSSETTDKTGATATVTEEPGRFTIAVDGQTVGLADFHDRAGARVFPHTEIDTAFEGRGLGTILVAHALQATKAAGLRIVPTCSMVAHYVDKHPEYADVTDVD